ncbi:hypothetical protein T11_18442 [Trichinella zimbabwensis]|uniref:Uncharacterized protein n=1 Tax=Trichinella zimbabwensis TaxID=268475 RepID=A0A0V1G9S2_9BILA|nr:hypothetical protein T11_18442 [Trichinella zimbabwensis]
MPFIAAVSQDSQLNSTLDEGPYLHKSQTLRDLLRALDMPFEDELQHNINNLDTFL